MLHQPISEKQVPTTKLGILAEAGAFVGLAIVSKFVVNQFTQNFSGPISLVFTLSILTVYLKPFWSFCLLWLSLRPF
jgi:hypothetical protein